MSESEIKAVFMRSEIGMLLGKRLKMQPCPGVAEGEQSQSLELRLNPMPVSVVRKAESEEERRKLGRRRGGQKDQ